MAGKWLIRQEIRGRRWYITVAKIIRLEKRSERAFCLVQQPSLAKRFWSKESAETVAFNIVRKDPNLIGTLTVVAWDGNRNTKP